MKPAARIKGRIETLSERATMPQTDGISSFCQLVRAVIVPLVLIVLLGCHSDQSKEEALSDTVSQAALVGTEQPLPAGAIRLDTGDVDEWPRIVLPLEIEEQVPELPPGIAGPTTDSGVQ